MDRNSSSSSAFISGPWTNEKHLHYLNSVEASFVHTMLENNNNNTNNGHHLRLDRYMPDTSDSTLDLKTHRTRKKKHATTTITPSAGHDIIGPKNGIDSRVDKRFSRRHSHQPYSSLQDQVVPQIGNRRGNKDENDPFEAPTK